MLKVNNENTRTIQGPNLEKKIASQKTPGCSEENSKLQAKNFLGFVKRFSEFARVIYENAIVCLARWLRDEIVSGN